MIMTTPSRQRLLVIFLFKMTTHYFDILNFVAFSISSKEKTLKNEKRENLEFPNIRFCTKNNCSAFS